MVWMQQQYGYFNNSETASSTPVAEAFLFIMTGIQQVEVTFESFVIINILFEFISLLYVIKTEENKSMA